MTDNESGHNRTPLYDLHVERGGRMVSFAGYDLPVQYSAGIIAEHLHTRSQASMFDVSHMGQVRIDGAARAVALESLLPADIQGLHEGAIRYSFFTNGLGGILDDLMIGNGGDCLNIVVNAACKKADLEILRTGLAGAAEVSEEAGLALLALQGPSAAEVLTRFAPDAGRMAFMTFARFDIGGISCRVSRSGYSGEDGYEISAPAGEAEALARLLLAEAEVELAGLGARDSLRLEAGLCLYGHDIDETTTPVEAGLTWAIQKRRREEGGFPGAEVIRRQLAERPSRRRVGLRPEGRAPLREGVEIAAPDGRVIGKVTSGLFGPTVGGPVAMGYVERDHAAAGTALSALVRGKALACHVVKLPFVPQNYYRG
jgi:aminomethyltransferase